MIALTEVETKLSSGYTLGVQGIFIAMYLLSNTLMLHVLMCFIFFCFVILFLKTDGSVYCNCGVLHVNSKLLKKQTNKTNKQTC